MAARLTRDGVPCPSAHDPGRNPHRGKVAWQQGAVRAILLNPRYIGYEVWNKQRKEERLLDIDDVTLGHTTRMTHNPTEQWIRSNEPAHEAIISPDHFDAVQALHRQRAGNQGRQERAGKPSARPYALRGRVRCMLCGRKMQPATIRDRVYYRCQFTEHEAALHPDHPRTVYLREDIVCQALDRRLRTRPAHRHGRRPVPPQAPPSRRHPRRPKPAKQGLRPPPRPLPGRSRRRRRPRRRHPMDQRSAPRQGKRPEAARHTPPREPAEGATARRPPHPTDHGRPRRHRTTHSLGERRQEGAALRSPPASRSPTNTKRGPRP
ncbi:recombinase family protein [Streptomyces wuyuanensis]|uniref:recombinase family protein n=1 Tax=Streptomyces wuyuanensis TaxID=1196353 RepID=UPI0038237BBA